MKRVKRRSYARLAEWITDVRYCIIFKLKLAYKMMMTNKIYWIVLGGLVLVLAVQFVRLYVANNKRLQAKHTKDMNKALQNVHATSEKQEKSK